MCSVTAVCSEIPVREWVGQDFARRTANVQDMTVLEQPPATPSVVGSSDIRRFFTNSDQSVYALKNLPE